MTTELREGDVVAGRYLLETLVGRGAMGRVYRAHDRQRGAVVAIKVLDASRADSNLRSRFQREARAMSSLASEHVVRVLDYGVLDGDLPYIVLEYLEGSDLREVITTRGRLPSREACDYVIMTCDGLAEAHLAGIIHRDLKPHNLFLTRRPDGTPCVKILDFGVSKTSAAQSTTGLTRSFVMIGSPAFVSPEQMRDARSVDARSDVWALGVVLYMLLAADKPFPGEDITATCAAIAADPPLPLRARGIDVPEPLEAAVMRCLEKKRDERTPNVAALARDLAPFASSAGRALAERVAAVFAARGIAIDQPSARVPPAPSSDVTLTELKSTAPKPILPASRHQPAPVYRPRPTKPKA